MIFEINISGGPGAAEDECVFVRYAKKKKLKKLKPFVNFLTEAQHDFDTKIRDRVLERNAVTGHNFYKNILDESKRVKNISFPSVRFSALVSCKTS